jgi:hypothetical protein
MKDINLWGTEKGTGKKERNSLFVSTQARRKVSQNFVLFTKKFIKIGGLLQDVID